jgi:hypothetical protein
LGLKTQLESVRFSQFKPTTTQRSFFLGFVGFGSVREILSTLLAPTYLPVQWRNQNYVVLCKKNCVLVDFIFENGLVALGQKKFV